MVKQTGPPRIVPLAAVKDYLNDEYDIVVTRQTVYNWANHGKRGTLLKTLSRAGKLYTTERWLDAFVSGAGVR